MEVEVRHRRARGIGVGILLGNIFSYRTFITAIVVLLSFTSALLVILTNTRNGNSYDPQKKFIALNSGYQEKISLKDAYAAYSGNLRLELSRQLQLYDHLSHHRQSGKKVNDTITVARSIIQERKDNLYDNQEKIQKLKDTIFAINELVLKAKRMDAFKRRVALDSVPKSLSCLVDRLLKERNAHPDKYANGEPRPQFQDPSLYHYAMFSNNVIASSVVVNSALKNAREPWKHVFHIVTDKMVADAMRVWFKMQPTQNGARKNVEIKSLEDFPAVLQKFKMENNTAEKRKRVWLKMKRAQMALEDFPVLEKMDNNITGKEKYEDSSMLLNRLLFYLPELFPKLDRILYLEDDIVVQKDLSELWRINMEGKINGAVETSFGSIHRYAEYLDFTNFYLKMRFDPKACAWAFGMNVFDLAAWRRQTLSTQNLNYRKDYLSGDQSSLWKLGVLPAGLMSFYSSTKILDKSWHLLGLGFNPSIDMEKINNASVIHFNGKLKPWLDVALRQYKHLWTKYVDDSEMGYLQTCKFRM